MKPSLSRLPTRGLVCAALAASVVASSGCRVDTTGNEGDSAILQDGGADSGPGENDGGGTDASNDGAVVSPPEIELNMPAGPFAFGDFTVTYALLDTQSDAVAIAVTFSTGGPAAPATGGAGGDGVAGLTSSPAPGVPHAYEWASAADVPGDVDGVELCFTPSDASGAGSTQCLTLDVRNGAAMNTGVKINEIGVGAPDYVEVVNTGTVAIDLSAWQVLWTSTNGASGSMVIPPLVLMPGDVVELREGFGMDNPTLVHIGSNAEWDEALGGSVDLIDDVLVGVDFARWGGDGTAPSPPGVWTEGAPLPTPFNGIEGLSRSSALDTDDAIDFCATSATPGAPNSPCPPPPAPIAAADILITEVETGDFGGSPDRFELLNTTTGTINLAGAVVRVEDEGVVIPYVLPAFALAPGARVLIVDNTGGPGLDTIMLPDNIAWFDMTSAMSLGLEDSFGSGVDFVGFGTSVEVPAAPAGWSGAVMVPGPGVSASRVPDTTDTDTDADWCLGVVTTLAPNACQQLAGDVTIVINELTTGAPDWLELANLGTTDVDIGGWSLEFTNDGTFTDVFTFDTSAVIPAGGFLVVADGDPGAPFFDMGFFNIDWGTMTGNQGSLALIDPAGDGEDFVRFGGNGVAPPGGTAWTEAAALPTVGAAEFLNRTVAAGGVPVDTDDAADFCVFTADTVNAENPVCP